MIFSYGPLHTNAEELDNQQEHIYNSSVRIQDIAWKITWKRWTLETNSEGDSGKSTLAIWFENDDIYIYIYICIYIYIYMRLCVCVVIGNRLADTRSKPELSCLRCTLDKIWINLFFQKSLIHCIVGCVL